MASFRYKDTSRNKYQDVSNPQTFGELEVRSLVERAVDGDFEAFGEIYSIYLDRIYRYVVYQVDDKMIAEDLTEETFIKAWGAIGKYKWKGQPFSAWLYRIAHNQVIDYFRTTRRDLTLKEELPAEAAEPEQEAEEKLRQRELIKAISYLPAQQKQVIILKFIEGLENPEIAQIMQKSQGAIRVMQMRALAALRQKLSGEANKWKLNYLRP